MKARCERLGRFSVLFVFGFFLSFAINAIAADTVPTDAQMPGTQPGEVSNLESPGKCDNCHGGYDPAAEMAHSWRGSMMSHAGRDPIFWATVAIAEQDFDGSGDLCIRCHAPGGWLAGRSTPTDGSGLTAADVEVGVECDFCHQLTDTDNSEHQGVQNAPFVANDGANPAEGHYGSGQYAMWGQNSKLGPYDDADARHQFLKSNFHRSADLCGTCHDVSNPVVGDLAPNHGAQVPLQAGTFSGTPGTAVETKAAFNNRPYQYGAVERTFSEHQSSQLSSLRVADYVNLPAELQDGALKAAFDAAQLAGANGDYADGTPRYFTCQTCHMPPVIGEGCNKNPPVRADLPLHDLTGGNYWMPEVIQYMDAQGTLTFGAGLSSDEVAGLNDGILRAMSNLNEAAAVTVSGNVVRVVNLTGHKLISGYPEGRRMWLNTKWYDTNNVLLREDGAYGPLTVEINGTPTTVETLLDLHDPNTRIYEAHGAITQDWAARLLEFGSPADLPVAYDRVTGALVASLGDVAGGAPGTYHESFHFVLNNQVIKDNRIPPFGMSFDEAQKRSALPVPADQYGNPGAGGAYNYFDEFTLSPPVGAVYATVELKYQPTSWEYIQFLALANTGQNPTLGAEGANLLDAWLATGMASPYVMASAVWGSAPAPQLDPLFIDSLATWDVSKKGDLVAPAATFNSGDTVASVIHATDAAAADLDGVVVTMEVRDSANTLITTLQGSTDATGQVQLDWKTARKQAAGAYSMNISAAVKDGFEFDVANSVTSATVTIQ